MTKFTAVKPWPGTLWLLSEQAQGVEPILSASYKRRLTLTPPTYHVVFADDNHDLICVAVPARTIGEAIEQVHTAVDFCPDVKVFEHPPLWPVGRAWSIDELEDHYDS